MVGNMHIRPFKEEDGDAVQQVHERAVRDVCSEDYAPDQVEVWTEYSREESPEAIKKDEVHRFVAVEDGEVIGFGEYDEDKREITGLYVHPDRMGNGAGEALLERVEQDAREHGLDTLECYSTITAKTFYERHGYEVIEETMYEMEDQELRVYFMRKTLD